MANKSVPNRENGEQQLDHVATICEIFGRPSMTDHRCANKKHGLDEATCVLSTEYTVGGMQHTISEFCGPTQPTQPGNWIRFGRACVRARAEKAEMLI